MWTSLKDFKNNRIHYELMLVADCVKLYGLSETVPVDVDGRFSLPAVVAMEAGMVRDRFKLSNNFDELLQSVPGWRVRSFIMCWDAIELEVEEDIVEWSERVGRDEVVRRIGSLANVIAHA